MTSKKIMSLELQKEIIEQWLLTPGIPTDAHSKLREMLGEVMTEMKTNRVLTSSKDRDTHDRSTILGNGARQ